jgi:hypothetical protein
MARTACRLAMHHVSLVRHRIQTLDQVIGQAMWVDLPLRHLLRSAGDAGVVDTGKEAIVRDTALVQSRPKRRLVPLRPYPPFLMGQVRQHQTQLPTAAAIARSACNPPQTLSVSTGSSSGIVIARTMREPRPAPRTSAVATWVGADTASGKP